MKVMDRNEQKLSIESHVSLTTMEEPVPDANQAESVSPSDSGQTSDHGRTSRHGPQPSDGPKETAEETRTDASESAAESGLAAIPADGGDSESEALSPSAWGDNSGESDLPSHRNLNGQPMDRRRFLTGLGLTTGGVALMLSVAFGFLRQIGATGQLSLPAIGFCMVIGIMMLGGGFGLMALAAPRFDDEEFDRD